MKKQLGQFYSTNTQDLLKDFTVPSSIVEPFVGNGDLIKWAITKGLKRYIAYDLDPPETLKFKCIIRDTLKSPPKYKDKFVLTNPPYLAKNKTTDKALYNKYDDLYKLFISQIVSAECAGGIIIIPINFLSSVREQDCILRDSLFTNYQIQQINIFLNPIFADTTYSVISISFLKDSLQTEQKIKLYWHDTKEYTELHFNKKEKWLIGYEVLISPAESKYKIGRLLSKTDKTDHNILNIKLHALDTRETPIHLEYTTAHYYGKSTDRMFATLTCNVELPEDTQKKIVQIFNKQLTDYRKKYHSMFLTNFRDFGRKRIGFDLVYKMVERILTNL